MSSLLLERLHRLAALWGPSGREYKVAAALEELIRPYVDEVRTDAIGNLIAVKNGAPGGKRVMLTAHMDTPGALALEVSEEGLIQLAPVGDLKVHHLIGQRVVWGSGVVGVIQHEAVDESKDLAFRKLWCDIGARSREEALANVPLGDMCTLVGELQQMGADLITGPGLNNRAGCAVLLEVAEHLQGALHEVAFVFATQGAVGPRGVAPAAYGLQPDAAFVVEMTPSGGLPGGPKVAVRLGEGPALKLKDASFVAHWRLSELVRSVAEAEKIPLQTEINSDVDRTGARAVAAAGYGVPTAALDLPARYLGTAGEMVSLRDLMGAADLLMKLLQGSLAF